MRATIEGVDYNTQAGVEIAHWGDALPRHDPRHVFNTLYRTSAGAWFVHQRRGANEDIMPLTDERVQRLLQEKHLDYPLMRYFCDPVKKVPAVAGFKGA